jgi:glutamate formiminotransferase/formiminotetrahydrofolate cyclodeaminase
MNAIVECVPNFSEGRDPAIINEIVSAIKSEKDIVVLNVDMGYDANRTVVTFAGPPKAVGRAAFAGIEKASQLIDMRNHKGKHPRMGATDVCPLIPVKGITMLEVIQVAKQLAFRVGSELNIPVYMYEYNANSPERRNLSDIRKGEYEGLEDKIKDANWKPDYGPAKFNKKAGATIIGARKFLIAYNINLDTTNVEIAKLIARTIRESGYRHNDRHYPGKMKTLKAIGWYMPQYRCAQVSTNITDFEITPIHRVFEAVAEEAKKYHVEASGSELVGMIPEEAFMISLNQFNTNQEGLINLLGLNSVKPFNPEEHILERKIATLLAEKQ